MKTIRSAAFLSVSLIGYALHAQGFNSGSNGSYGPLNITTTATLDLPADGIFHCTTINISSGATLRFNRNPLNTPVYLLATGDVTIAGTINVNGNNTAPGNGFTGGQGGPGGFDGGASGFISTGVTRPAGSGMGPGGGTHGTSATVGGGGFGSVNTTTGTRVHGSIYGNALLIPLIGGSGGGGVDGSTSVGSGYGGGGGGAVLIASNTKITLSGTIVAQAGIGSGGSIGGANYGSGGAVRLVAPRVFGNGSIGVGNFSGFSTIASGRIRIDSLLKVDPVDPSQFLSISYTPTTAATVGSNLIVFPPNNPRLDITQAAGTNIAEGVTQPVIVLLPIDAPTAQTVRVQARNFSASVPIRVALIPESGDVTFFDSTIDNTTTNPATTIVNVTMPTNVKVNVQVWTR